MFKWNTKPKGMNLQCFILHEQKSLMISYQLLKWVNSFFFNVTFFGTPYSMQMQCCFILNMIDCILCPALLLHAKDSYDYLGGYRNKKLSYLNETYLKVNMYTSLLSSSVPELGIVGTNKDCYMLIIGWKENENRWFQTIY